jgi:endonuclease-3
MRQDSNRVTKILGILNKAHKDARCGLRHGNALELLVATILSAQCTDERVNVVTRDLFLKYRSPEDYMRAPIEELEQDIHSTGFYRNKAKNIQGACRVMLDKFGGNVPNTMQALVELPGVARKTANVVLGVAFGKAEGIVVDTHVFRVSKRLGLSKADVPEKVELDLLRIIPRKRWIALSFQMIQHGRLFCKARKPLCSVCSLEKLCRSRDKAIDVSPPKGMGRRGARIRKRV